MSLRQEILKEIKSLLNEAEGADQRFDAIKAKFDSKNVDQVRKTTTPAEAKEFLAAVKDVVAQRTYGQPSTGITGGYKNNATGAQKLSVICKLGNVGGQYDFLMTRDKQKVQWCNEQAGASPTPPEPSAGGGKENIEVTTTDSSLKGPGCKPGSVYIGKNGKVGPNNVEVENIQFILANKLSQLSTGGGSGASMKSTVFTFAKHEDPVGKFGLATETAVKEFQRIYGQQFAQKVKSLLGREHPLDTVDGCVGPKTACALILTEAAMPSRQQSRVEQVIAGYTLQKCKQRFGAKNVGQGKIAESKNWADRTREDTTSSLFERLVKDVSNKKVI